MLGFDVVYLLPISGLSAFLFPSYGSISEIISVGILIFSRRGKNR